jgi:catechol 2,3-dioxygenase-like lactoylglutathione lyase family enzyme
MTPQITGMVELTTSRSSLFRDEPESHSTVGVGNRSRPRPPLRHAPANTPGIRHIAFAVEDIDTVVAGLRARAELVGELERYKDSYRLCYVRGPEGIIIELAEQIG